MSSAQKSARRSSRSTSATIKKPKGFTEEERSAMKDRVQEMKGDESNGENAVLAKIAEMPEPDRTMAKRFHAIIRANAPTLVPRLWYGMPAYSKDGNVLCHFQPASKFKTRYAALGFSDEANLDEGEMRPNAFALKGLAAAEESRIAALVKKAVR